MHRVASSQSCKLLAARWSWGGLGVVQSHIALLWPIPNNTHRVQEREAAQPIDDDHICCPHLPKPAARKLGKRTIRILVGLLGPTPIGWYQLPPMVWTWAPSRTNL